MFSDGTNRKVRKWRVEDGETLSDHKYVVFEITGGQTGTVKRKWVRRGTNKAVFIQLIAESVQGRNLEYTPEECTCIIQDAYNRSTPKIQTDGDGNPPYWWTSAIAEARRKSLEARRELTRYRKRRDKDLEMEMEKAANYKSRKRDLRVEIEKSKRNCWTKLCDDLNGDLWGEVYQITRRALNLKHQTAVDLSDEEKTVMVQQLFPRHEAETWERPAAHIPIQFDEEELKAAAAKLKTGTALVWTAFLRNA